MSKTKKIIIYGLMAFLGVLIFTLEVFVFQKPDGVIGLLIAISTSLSAIFGIIGLCTLSAKFRNAFVNFLDIIGWIPFD